jgi:hypothetical protein
MLLTIEASINDCKLARDPTTDKVATLPMTLWYAIGAYIVSMIIFVFISYRNKKSGTVIKSNSIYNWRNIGDNLFFIRQLADEQYKACGLTMENKNEPAIILKTFINKLDTEKKEGSGWFSKTFLKGTTAELPTTKYPNIVKMKAILEASAKKK